MAGDWIKWEKGLVRKPEVFRTSQALATTELEAAALWMVFWEWADCLTTDGAIHRIIPADVDRIVGRPGFAAAGESVGWLIFDDGDLLIPNFCRHNGKSAKKRARNAEVQRLKRKDGEPQSP